MTNSITLDFTLSTLTITTISGSVVDIKNIFQEVNIFEDIYSNSISGELLVLDAANQIKNMPILGFETLTISFNSPNRKSISGSYFIYKISDREPGKDKSQQYILHFCSQEQITNDSVNIGKSYNGKLISNIVSDIQTNSLNSTLCYVEPTKFLHSIIIPNTFNPFKAINWLSTRANSATYNGAGYVYFQNRNGYNFVSLEKLNSNNSVIQYVYGVANVGKLNQGNTTHTDSDSDLDSRSILDYKIEKHIDVLANLSNGMYSNRVYTYDFLNKSFDFTDFSYSENYNNLVHTESNKGYNQLTRQSGDRKMITSQLQSNVSPESYTRFFVKNGSEPFPNNVENWLSKRISQLQEINNITMKIAVPGDSDRTIGEIVNVLLPSAEAPVNNQLLFDDYFKGRYLITSLRHVIQQQQYTTYMELVKDWSLVQFLDKNSFPPR